MAGPARIAAKRFNVSESTVYMIRERHIWKHIE
jgi:transposase